MLSLSKHEFLRERIKQNNAKEYLGPSKQGNLNQRADARWLDGRVEPGHGENEGDLVVSCSARTGLCPRVSTYALCVSGGHARLSGMTPNCVARHQRWLPSLPSPRLPKFCKNPPAGGGAKRRLRKVPTNRSDC